MQRAQGKETMHTLMSHVLEHIRNSIMEKQIKTLCLDPTMCMEQIQGCVRMFIETSRGVSPHRNLQEHNILLCRSSKLWLEHCPCLNSLNQDFTISLREKLFEKPTQDSSFSMLPLFQSFQQNFFIFFSLLYFTAPFSFYPSLLSILLLLISCSTQFQPVIRPSH